MKAMLRSWAWALSGFLRGATQDEKLNLGLRESGVELLLGAIPPKPVRDRPVNEKGPADDAGGREFSPKS